MRRTYQVTGLVLLPVALFLGYHATRLSYYTSIGPGPGFFPVWLCGLLALLAVVMIVQASFGSPEPMPAGFFVDHPGVLRIAVAVSGLFAAAGLMGMLGFRLTSFIFYAVLLVVLGRRNPIEIAALAAVGSLGVYTLFSQVLSQPLPIGVLGW